MIQNLSDAKRLVVDMYNSILESLERKDTEVRRQTIDLLRDLFEADNYRVTDKFTDEIHFESKQSFPDATWKRHHDITLVMEFSWRYYDEDGWNIWVWIKRWESYNTDEGHYFAHRCFSIEWNVSQKKCRRIRREFNESTFTPIR